MLPASTAPRPSVRDHGAHFAPDGRQAVTGRVRQQFHIASPIQDQFGVITPSSLHYVATTGGSYIPDIDPKQHTLTIHGLVDQPLTLTMEDLKRLPSVTRLQFVECAGTGTMGDKRPCRNRT